MCNLSDYIEEKATQRGMQKGIQKGIQLNLLQNLQALMTNLNLTAEKAMDVLNVPQEERAYYLQQLQ